MPDVTPQQCESQSVRIKRYVENNHAKVAFEADHDTHRCPICKLCCRHCIEHFNVLDGVRLRLHPVSYAALRREREALQEAATAKLTLLRQSIEPIIRKRRQAERQAA